MCDTENTASTPREQTPGYRNLHCYRALLIFAGNAETPAYGKYLSLSPGGTPWLARDVHEAHQFPLPADESQSEEGAAQEIHRMYANFASMSGAKELRVLKMMKMLN